MVAGGGESAEVRLARLEERHTAHRELVAEQTRGRDEAQALKAEADRVHFLALNNEAGRIAEAAEKSVSREVYDADQKAIGILLSGLSQQLDRLAGGSTGRQQLWAWALGALAAIGTITSIILALR